MPAILKQESINFFFQVYFISDISLHSVNNKILYYPTITFSLQQQECLQNGKWENMMWTIAGDADTPPHNSSAGTVACSIKVCHCVAFGR